MTTKPPPIPSANRSPKGPGEKANATKEDTSLKDKSSKADQDNIRQNTRHQGYQQDR